MSNQNTLQATSEMFTRELEQKLREKLFHMKWSETVLNTPELREIFNQVDFSIYKEDDLNRLSGELMKAGYRLHYEMPKTDDMIKIQDETTVHIDFTGVKLRLIQETIVVEV